jgi:hypothetical protein
MNPQKNFFILGGEDGEMARIREHLTALDIRWIQPVKGWGTKEFGPDTIGAEGMAPGTRVVFVECVPAADFPRTRVHVVVDHHGDNAGLPASIMQVLDLLKIEPTRWDDLVAANDEAYFPGLQAMGATRAEIDSVRAHCRAAQGISPEQEAEAARALAAPIEMIGNIRIFRMAHSKCAPIGDTLAVEAIAAGKPVPEHLVLSDDGEANFSGDAALAKALYDRYREPNPARAFAGGVDLGKAGKTAYWGGYPDFAELLAFIREYVCAA